jgi:hypothetical protein
MSRHLNNLKQLLSKMQVRYGEDDALVSQLRDEVQALEARKASESRPAHPNWSMPYREFIKSSSMQHP